MDDNLPENPMKLFEQWFEEALRSEVIEPNAMALATVSSAGTPNVRMVLLKRLPESVSKNYFQFRPRDSQIGAWASEQSKPVADRVELKMKFSEIELRFKDQEIPKPEHWGGFKITIQEMEFWQGRPGRLHDRIYYIQSSGKWNRERLAP
jgi:pyridoxamine 5'-phosphate oxidase